MAQRQLVCRLRHAPAPPPLHELEAAAMVAHRQLVPRLRHAPAPLHEPAAAGMAHPQLVPRLLYAPALHRHRKSDTFFPLAVRPSPSPPATAADEPSPSPRRRGSSSRSRLFVAGLSWSADERSLTDAFSSFGTVTEVRIMYDKNSGRSRGFGFVHFSNDYEAKCAKDAMDGKVMLGRPLRISFALDKVRGAPVVVPRLPTAG